MARPNKGRSLLEMPRNFVVIDIETTGLKPETNEIIEIGAIKVENMVVVDVFQEFVKPQNKIPSFITQFTGITNEMVIDAPSISDVLLHFIRFIGDDLLMGHNVNFDINFIYEGLMRELNMSLTNDFVDTLRVARNRLKGLPNYKLGTLAHYFDINSDDHHRALKDCQMTFEIYKKLHDLN